MPAIDSVPLGDAAEVDADAGPAKAHRGRLRDQLDVTVVDSGQGCGDRLRARMNPGAVVVEVSHARIGDVEGAPRELRILD